MADLTCQTTDEHGDPLCARPIAQRPCDTCPAVSMGERVQLDRRREWADALRWFADHEESDPYRCTWGYPALLRDAADRIEAGTLTPWASEPSAPPAEPSQERPEGAHPYPGEGSGAETATDGAGERRALTRRALTGEDVDRD